MCLPVFLAGCDKLLVIPGKTYSTRLWCMMELFIYFNLSHVRVRILLRTRNLWSGWNLPPASFAPADLPKQNFVLANPRNFLDVEVQSSGGFAKTVRGFASANDADRKFGQAH